MWNKLTRVFAGGTVALIVALVALFLAGNIIQRGPGSPSDPRLARFEAWPEIYRGLDGNAEFPVVLSHIRGLSDVDSTASGTAVINFEEGTVILSVQGLPALPEGSAYQGLLVDNVSGPGNSVALDRGPGGDDVIELGQLTIHDTRGTLDWSLDPARLRGFEVDMVTVIRKMPGVGEEFVVGGIPSLFYKMGRRASLVAERELDEPGSSPIALLRGLGGKLTSPLTASASGPSVVNQAILGLIQQGEVLFSQETFDGNGKTCATCHRLENNFTIDAAFIATLPANDPLFVAEFNPALAQLENPTLMRGPRALILENIDGFSKAPMFRGAPPTINMAFTGPYGLSEGFATISEFDFGAVAQHFTKNTGGDPGNITRVPGLDFRLPTQQELDALEAFQLSIFVPRRQEFDLERFLTTDAQRRGRDLFFGEAKCSECHGGTVLSEASLALGGGNQAFNTGVANLPINAGANGGFGPLPLEAGGAREFSTPPLFNVKNTAPFFHDNSVETLRETVAFYDSVQFNQSPAADPVTGAGPIGLTEAQTDDLVAFLEALADPEKIVDLRLVLSQPVVQVGDSFTVAVQVEPNGQQLTGVELLISFDPQGLQVTGIEAITGDLNVVLISSFDNVGGTIHHAAGALDKAFPTGDFAVANFSFQATENGSHTVSFSTKGAAATRADFGGDDVLDEVIGATVTVTPPWDVNADGRVDPKDLRIVASSFGPSPLSNPRADVNNDGLVDIRDLVEVAKNLAPTPSPGP